MLKDEDYEKVDNEKVDNEKLKADFEPKKICKEFRHIGKKMQRRAVTKIS